MLIGVPKEIKTQEYRVGLVPGSVRELVHHGHSLLVEAGAGLGTGFGDEAYIGAGAAIAGDAAEVFAKADMIVKVKEPQAEEIRLLRSGQILFTYLHLAADKLPRGRLAQLSLALHLRDVTERNITQAHTAYEQLTDFERVEVNSPPAHVEYFLEIIRTRDACADLGMGGKCVFLSNRHIRFYDPCPRTSMTIIKLL